MADTQTDGKSTNTNGQEAQTINFEQWIADQPQEVVAAFTAHTGGLKSALEKERADRANLAKQLKELGPKALNAEQLQSELTKINGQLEAAQRQTTFLEQATAVGVVNTKLAWAAVQIDPTLFDGAKINEKAMREQYPQLFATRTPPAGNAGNGTANGVPNGKKGMDTFIRERVNR